MEDIENMLKSIKHDLQIIELLDELLNFFQLIKYRLENLNEI